VIAAQTGDLFGVEHDNLAAQFGDDVGIGCLEQWCVLGGKDARGIETQRLEDAPSDHIVIGRSARFCQAEFFFQQRLANLEHPGLRRIAQIPTRRAVVVDDLPAPLTPLAECLRPKLTDEHDGLIVGRFQRGGEQEIRLTIESDSRPAVDRVFDK
jgi:hypothetical protein